MHVSMHIRHPLLILVFLGAAVALLGCSSSTRITETTNGDEQPQECLNPFEASNPATTEPINDDATTGTQAPETRTDPRPNIILIMTDDQHWQSLGCMPIVTERLVGAGHTFSNAFVTSPNCCPARAGFLTGDYVADHGVYTNGLPRGGAAAFAPTGTVTEQLQQADYQTALFGKYLTSYRTESHGDPIGFDRYLTYDDTPNDTSQPDTFKFFDWTGSDDGAVSTFDGYSTDVFGEAARSFIENSGDKPFFVQYAPFAPHRPAALPNRHQGLENAYTRSEFPPNYGVTPSNPGWTNELEDAAWENTRQPEVETIRSQQLASLQAVDENIGALLDELESQDKLDNTVVIFTSDNGFAWGEHRWLHKLCPYEACIRVPLVVTDFRNPTPGTVDTRMVTNLDVAATIANLGGTFNAQQMPAAAPIQLGTGAKPVREHFLLENYGAGNGAKPLGIPAFQGVRTERHKYVRYPDGGEALFALTTDPYELTNVVNDAQEADELDRLRKITESSFPRKLERDAFKLEASDACLGDGDPITAAFDEALPATEDILGFELLLETDEALDVEVRRTLDLVAEEAGWEPEATIALPARVLGERTLALPATSRSVQILDTTELQTLQVEVAFVPDDVTCLTGDLVLTVDYLGKAES